MDAYMHAKLSMKRWGGTVDDYYRLHQLVDSTKELCSDNRHRILHTLWGVRRVILPIFGPTLTNSDGRAVLVKAICEQDHILPDYQNRFIPTLNDFVQAVEVEPAGAWREQIEACHQQYADNEPLRELLLSPLAQTGQLKSLLLTHNSWFLNEIAPKVVAHIPQLINFALAPSFFFERMRFELWMDNGTAVAPSARRIVT